MPFSDAQIEALEAPLSGAYVKKNPRGFDYIEAWHAIAEANRIFGFDGWDREAVELRQLGEPRQTGETMRVGYFCKVRITVRTAEGVVVREGCGYGSGIDRDVGQAHESAIKEAESDAMKRALMTFGNPFGLALYDKTKANVEGPVNPAPRSPAKAPPSPPAASPPPAAPKPTLKDRAQALIKAMQVAANDGAEAVNAKYKLGAALCAELDAKDPDTLAEVEFIYKGLMAEAQAVFA